MSQQDQPQLSEEELRALEAELERVTVDDVLLQTIVSLINLGARKGAVGAPSDAGLTPDYEQLRIAIESVRALMPILEPRHGDKLAQVRDALSTLQMAYARGAGEAGEVPAPSPEPTPPPAKSRLWVPGQ